MKPVYEGILSLTKFKMTEKLEMFIFIYILTFVIKVKCSRTTNFRKIKIFLFKRLVYFNQLMTEIHAILHYVFRGGGRAFSRLTRAK